MSVVSSTSQATSTVSQAPYASAFQTAGIRQRLYDYADLCRPRIAVMTMVSVAVGFTLASPIVFNMPVLLTSLAGIVQLVAASSILNQCLERTTDRLMVRTADRPIASNRISVWEAVSVATSLTAFGFTLLWNLVNPATALATLATLLVYCCAYTVLKTRTSVCTTIGAIPGAMPPVLGWLAAGGTFGPEVLALFAVFFVWQFPHFLAIGWIHRSDYQSAGLRMLPSFKDDGFLTGLLATSYAAAFVPISALPAYLGLSGDIYLIAAIGLSVAYLGFTVKFAADRSDRNARQLLFYSLMCLPALLIALVIDFLRLTSMG